jgi:SpoVK/Ycf46/Vps4 family AAA+-type ATPase
MTTATRLAEWLADLLHWAARQPRPVACCAAVHSAAALAPALRAVGCCDREVKVPALGSQGRAALLLAGFRSKGLAGFEGGLQALAAAASKGLEGFDAKDLQLVVDRAAHCALRRQLAAGARGVAAAGAPPLPPQQQQQQQQLLLVTADDLAAALSGYVPAAFWRAGHNKAGRQKQATEGGLQGWEDIGTLARACWVCSVAASLPTRSSQLSHTHFDTAQHTPFVAGQVAWMRLWLR